MGAVKAFAGACKHRKYQLFANAVDANSSTDEGALFAKRLTSAETRPRMYRPIPECKAIRMSMAIRLIPEVITQRLRNDSVPPFSKMMIHSPEEIVTLLEAGTKDWC